MSSELLSSLTGAVLAALPHGVLVLDDERVIVLANAAAETILERPASQLAGVRLDDVVVADARARLEGYWPRLLAQGAATAELGVVYSDGSRHAFDIEGRAAIAPGRHLLAIKDVTIRAQRDTALRDAELAGGTGRWHWDPAVARPQLSDGIYHLLGVDPDRVSEMRMDDIFGPAAMAQIAEAGRRSLQTGESFELDVEYRTADGRERWALFRGGPDHSPAFAGRGLRGTFTDITERKLAQEGLRLAAHDLREAQRLAHVGSWTMDLASGVTEWSDELFRIFGLEPGSPVPSEEEQRACFQPHEWAERKERIAHAIATGMACTMPATIRRPDGTVRNIVATGEPFRGPSGAVERLRVTVVDVTDVSELVAALGSSEAGYRTLVEEMDAIVYLSNMRTGIDWCSDKAREILGYPPELLAQPGFWLSLVVDEDQERMAAFWADIENIDATDAVYRMRRADGHQLWIEERWRPVLDPDGAVERWCAIVTDITRRRASDEALMRAERLDAVSRLAAAAAHDFGNVLMAIGMAHSELEDHVGPDDEAAPAVQSIGTAVDRGSSLARQLLAYGRDSSEGDPEVVEPVEMVTAMQPLLRGVAVPSRVEVALAPVGRVLVRRRALEQALLNLVINARDAMTPRGGHVSVATSEEDVPDDADLGLRAGRYVVVTVHDDGPGMPPEVLARALEPFFTTKENGTGLGLAGVQAAMHKAGGSVRIASAPGAGCRIDLLLPRLADA